MTWGGVNRYMRPLHTEKSPAADARFGEREREREDGAQTLHACAAQQCTTQKYINLHQTWAKLFLRKLIVHVTNH